MNFIVFFLLSKGKNESAFSNLSEVPNVTLFYFLNFAMFCFRHSIKLCFVSFSKITKSFSVYFLLSDMFFSFIKAKLAKEVMIFRSKKFPLQNC